MSKDIEKEKDKIEMNHETSTVTITFGDQAENHVGMEKIGKMADCGFDMEDLKNCQSKFEEQGYKCERIILNEYLPDEIKKEVEIEAAILIIRNGVLAILNDKDHDVGEYGMFGEHIVLDVDKKLKSYGTVKNKNARYNLCFADYEQDPDYENGKGRIIDFKNIPMTQKIRNMLPFYLGEKANELQAEGNYYYDIKKCGIGFHGDAERKKVVAIRLGASMPFHYQWFQDFKPIGNRCELIINNNDIYIMSEKATGNDWKKSKFPTLRHAAGSKHYLTIKEKKEKKEKITKKSTVKTTKSTKSTKATKSTKSTKATKAVKAVKAVKTVKATKTTKVTEENKPIKEIKVKTTKAKINKTVNDDKNVTQTKIIVKKITKSNPIKIEND